MRTFLPAFSLLIAATCLPLALSAQANLSLPGCEAAPEVRKVLDNNLDSTVLYKMKYEERMAYERKVLDGLMTQYPREIAPVLRYSSLLNQNAPDEYEAVRARWIQAAKDHPDDPLALAIAGKALVGKDTPQAIQLLQAAKDKAPSFPWPHLYLASVYATGKRADLQKTLANLEAFYTLCPGSTDSTAQWLLNKDQPLQPKVAAALRARLATETDPKRLNDYETLWGLEFRTHPPKEHDAVRAQVGLDLKRLESLNPHGDAPFQDLLITGYKQSGASKETITAMEDRLLKDFPHSDEAYNIVSDRWDKAHKDPEDETDTAAWTKHNKEYEEALKGWLHDYPDNNFLQNYAWFYAVQDDDQLSEKQGVAAMDDFLAKAKEYQGPQSEANSLPTAAGFLIEKKWQPARALDLAERGKAAIEKNRAQQNDNDNQSDEQLKSRKENNLMWDQYVDGMILQAAMQGANPESALKLKPVIEGPAPEDKRYLSSYWENRGRLAQVEKQNQDALAYYQIALASVTEPPKAYHGKVRDELGDEAHALWKAQGGTETAWALWSKPATPAAAQVADGAWEKATKKIPDFELSDMSGKTWKLKDLSGKTVLINLWATWCGPCQSELPHLEKFYEKVKDRKDIQILTFDIDEDLGVLDPFLKEKGFTFPVLPAYSTVVGLLDGFAIPQTWLVDPQGVWQSKQIGYGGGTDADFEKDMLQHLDAAKSLK